MMMTMTITNINLCSIKCDISLESAAQVGLESDDDDDNTNKNINLCSIKCDTLLELAAWVDLESYDDDNNNGKNHKSL